MYKVTQIPQKLDPGFKKEVSYEEVIREGNHPEICVWFMRKETSTEIYNTILTDACIDIIFDLKNREIFIGATKTSTVKIKNNIPFDYMGIRLRPGAAYHLFPNLAMVDCFKENAFENTKIPELARLNRIFDFETDEERLQEIYRFLDGFSSIVDDTWIELIDKAFNSENISMELNKFKDNLKIKDRTFYREVNKHYGISPKELINTIRLQKTLYSLFQKDFSTITELSHRLNYYDASHLNHEIKKYCGTHPSELIEKYNNL